MFSKIKVASGLLCVLAAFCVFQLVTVGLGFWSLTRTHDDAGDLSNLALKQVDAVNETTQRLWMRASTCRAPGRAWCAAARSRRTSCSTRASN
jgi:hypothetical protein